VFALTETAGAPVASSATTEKPAFEEVIIQMNLTGIATRTDGGPDDGYTAYINVTGHGTRMVPNGKGVQIKATDLAADILVVRNDDGVEVENYTALVGFHAQQASCVATGGEDGCFKFGLQLRGNRVDKIVDNQNDDGRVLAMNAHGDTVGAPDQEGVFMMEAKGQSTTQPDGKGSGAAHYNVELGGTGSIRSADAGGERSNGGAVHVPASSDPGATVGSKLTGAENAVARLT
jgi:hypothetical protein